MKIIIGSNNKGKIKELKDILNNDNYDIISMKDAGLNIEVEEDGETFEENAYKKASEVFKITGEATLADDSGLCVEALNGEPGVFSARYAGEDANDDDRINKLLKNMEVEKNRKAKFVCSIVLIDNKGKKHSFIGECGGEIAYQKKGLNGFGYDPVFIPNGYNKTFAEMNDIEKNNISHRGIAMRKLCEFLNKKTY